MVTLKELQDQGEAPTWLEDAGYSTLTKGYLLDNETPKGMYERISKASADRLGHPEYAPKFFELFWKNWLCPATPVAANMGTTRALPISCFGLSVPDTTKGIMGTMTEVAMLTKHGGGIGTYWGDVRSRGSVIHGNGFSEGIVPFLKILDSTIIGISQGSTRRGAASVYLPIEHGDFDEFINIRRPQGDVNRQCMNINHAVTIGDEFMQQVVDGDPDARRKWKEVLKSRFETGEPYLMFRDTVNRDRPDCYKGNNLEVKTSQLCSEITLFNDENHTFVCCLSSMNLTRWDEWKNTDAVYWSIWFLDGVMTEFIDRAKSIYGFERAVRFSEKSRALGLGVLGWHSYLQNRMVAMDSMEAYLENRVIFKHIQDKSLKASQDLAKEYGEPEWCQGYGIRNTHRNAVAPTASNSVISGNVSPGIEPLAANAYAHKTAKGTFLQKNRKLMEVLETHKQNTDEVWKSIVQNEGSVQHLNFLDENEKAVFLTAREINQFVLVKLAAARQPFIDQTQSVNLFFPANTDPGYFNQVHLEAWRSGMHTLYYTRTTSVLKGDAGASYKRDAGECSMCEG